MCDKHTHSIVGLMDGKGTERGGLGTVEEKGFYKKFRSLWCEDMKKYLKTFHNRPVFWIILGNKVVFLIMTNMRMLAIPLKYYEYP